MKYAGSVAIAVLVVLIGLVVGVTFELLWSRRRSASKSNVRASHGQASDVRSSDAETLKPSQPRLPEPRFIDDGEGFRIIGPVEFDDPGAGPWEVDDTGRSDPGS